MPAGIGGGGFLGVAPEVTTGTFVAPLKFFPITNETLTHSNNPQWRRDIRQNVDAYDIVPGNVGVSGDLEFVATEDVVAYMLRCTRLTAVKSGVTPNFVYTFTPNANAVPAKSFSITVVKNNIVFAYVGCIISSFTLRTDDSLLMMRCSMLGTDEATQTLPVPTFLQEAAYGAGMYRIEIPAATQVFTVDTFDFSVEDNGALQYRLKDTGRGAQYANYGARDATLTYDADFFDKTDYDLYKALTSHAVLVRAVENVNRSVEITMPRAYREEYTVALGSQGDLIRAHCVTRGTFDNTTSRAYQIIVKTGEDFTPP
jgi:hypothetical protein